MTIATPTLEQSVAVVAKVFGAAVVKFVIDATMIIRIVHGLNDGKDYGRDFAGQNPTIPFGASHGSLADMIAQGVALRSAVESAVTALVAAAAGDAAGFKDQAKALVIALRQACADPRDSIRILTTLSSFDQPVLAGTDAIGNEIVGLAHNASVLFRQKSAIELAAASADFQPSSQQDANSNALAIGDVLDTVAEEAADRFQDPSYAALSGLRVGVVEDLLARGASLAPVVTREMPRPMPAVTVAYRLYQDAARADDLVARNDPPHPLFLPVTLEALAR
jgi:prophage DNA circulation protein